MQNDLYVRSISIRSLYTFVVLYLNKSIYPGIDLRSIRSVVIFFAGLSTVVVTHKVVSHIVTSVVNLFQKELVRHSGDAVSYLPS